MGMLDSMFGGGTELTMSLDTPQASPGGVVGGKLTLVGGKKPLKLTELTVKLLFVSVHSREDSALPDIKTEVLLTQTIAAGEDLPPGAPKGYTFRFTVPYGQEVTAHNVSYTVMAAADIPGVKDPSAQAELRIVEPSDDEHRLLPIEEIFSRFPNLRSTAEHEQVDALNDLYVACYGEGSQLMEVEPFLNHLMRTGTVNVRRGALTAWANLVDNRVKPEHLQTLYGVANIPGLDSETFNQVIIAACKFAEEGAYGLVQQLAQASDPEIRREVASGLRFHASNKFNGKRELVVALSQDQDEQVRANAVGAFCDYTDDHQVMYGVANQADRDPSPKVQAACINALGLAHYHGLAELTLSVYEKHTQNPAREVKKEIASSIHWLPKQYFQRIWGIVQRLMADPDAEVRQAMAFQFCNLDEMPQLLPIVQQAAQQDPSSEVRYECIASMSSMMQPEQAAHVYGQLLSQDPSEEMGWAAVRGLRTHNEHAAAKKVLLTLQQSQFAGVSQAARDALTR